MLRETLLVPAVGSDPSKLDKLLEPAVDELRAGRPVAIPTETVYGLAANALCPEACKLIFATKNRPMDNPLIVHIASLEMLRTLVRPRMCAIDSHRERNGKEEVTSSSSLPSLLGSTDILDDLAVPSSLKPVLCRFWPGPLTVLLPRRSDVSDVITAGLDTVAVRFPAHPIAQRIIELCGFPLAAPSANLSGRPSPTRVEHVLEDLETRLAVIVDGGPSSFGLESTVLDATRSPPMILRPGAITLKMLQEYLPGVVVFKKSGSEGLTAEEIKQMEDRPATPGMKYRHYSPTSPLVLFDGTAEAVEGHLHQFIMDELETGHRLVRLTLKPSSTPINNPNYNEFVLSATGNHEEIARNLFAGLRAADLLHPDLIVAQSVEDEEQGLAIMNRLSKAASITRHYN